MFLPTLLSCSHHFLHALILLHERNTVEAVLFVKHPCIIIIIIIKLLMLVVVLNIIDVPITIYIFSLSQIYCILFHVSLYFVHVQCTLSVN